MIAGWSLLLFTLIVQACVGAMVWIEFLHLVPAGHRRAELPVTIRTTTMLGVTVGIGAAALISFLHLGSPMKAVFVLNNLGTSWLSREILLLLLFGGSVALATAMWRRGWGSEASRILLSRSSTVVGIVLVFVMARLYMLPTTPSWSTAATPISFFATCLILGGAVVLAGMTYSRNASPSPVTARTIIVWTLVICLGMEIALIPVQAGILYDHPMVIDKGTRLATLNILLAVRVLSVVGALGFLIKFLVGTLKQPGRWALTIIALIILAEVVGRYIFYAFYYSIGV